MNDEEGQEIEREIKGRKVGSYNEMIRVAKKYIGEKWNV